MGNPNWSRTARAAAETNNLFAGCNEPARASELAKKTNGPVRDNKGELHHPCGCVVGRNLLNEIPRGPCPKHG